MSQLKVFLIITIIIVVSILVVLLPDRNNQLSLIFTSIGSLGALAALYFVYKVFITYSAPIDIQKKRFELVDKALAFFITKRFFIITDTQHTFYTYFTKQRLDFCTQGLIEDNRDFCTVIMSVEVFEYLIEFQSQLEHHYFPYQLKMLILSHLPQALSLSTGSVFDGKIRLTCSYDADKYGHPMMPNGTVDIMGFINSMTIIRTAMIKYLNNGVPSEHAIIDQEI